MRFFDAHCDTIGPLWEGKADFVTGAMAAGDAGPHDDATRDSDVNTHGSAAPGAGDGAEAAAHSGPDRLHVTLPTLRAAGVRAQVFASWVWSTAYPGRELEVGLGKVEAVRRLCDEHPDDLFFARTGAEVTAACEAPEAGAPAGAPAGTPTRGDGRRPETAGGAPDGDRPRTAVIASLEGADPLQGDVDNLDLFYEAGVRLITLAWGDNAFCGTVFGEGGGLTAMGADLVAACEDRRVLVDVSHASDQAFADICRVATRPLAASHSDCRSLSPNPRNLTDEMIRALAERGGVLGVNLCPSFLSSAYNEAERPINEEFWRAVKVDGVPFEEAGRRGAAARALIPRPPLALLVDHVRHAIKVGGEDCVGLGGDLDGIEVLPDGLEGVGDYPRIAELLAEARLTPAQVEKVCFGNFARLFRETVG